MAVAALFLLSSSSSLLPFNTQLLIEVFSDVRSSIYFCLIIHCACLFHGTYYVVFRLFAVFLTEIFYFCKQIVPPKRKKWNSHSVQGCIRFQKGSCVCILRRKKMRSTGEGPSAGTQVPQAWWTLLMGLSNAYLWSWATVWGVRLRYEKDVVRKKSV